MRSKEKNERELIENLYWNKRLSQRKIAEKLGISQASVSLKMRKLGIERRPKTETLKPWPKGKKLPRSTRKKISESLKGNKPWNKGLSDEEANKTRNLAKRKCVICGRRFGSISNRRKICLSEEDKETLHRLYVEEDKTANEISKIFGVDGATISKYLRKAGIKIDSKRKMRKGLKCGWNKKPPKEFWEYVSSGKGWKEGKKKHDRFLEKVRDKLNERGLITVFLGKYEVIPDIITFNPEDKTLHLIEYTSKKKVEEKRERYKKLEEFDTIFVSHKKEEVLEQSKSV